MLPLGNTQIRQALVDIFYLTTESLVRRLIDDERLLLTIVLSKVNGVIIHRFIVIKNDLIDPMVGTNICLQCTFIIDGGKEHIVYRKKLFIIGSITGFVLSSASKHVNFLS